MLKGRLISKCKTTKKKQSQEKKDRTHRVIKKVFKTTYFIARKKWAVPENFAELIDFLKNIGDEDIPKHLVECSSRSSYISETSCYEFLSCLGDYLETKMKNRLIAAEDFSLLTDDSTDISNRAELSIFVRYIDSDAYDKKEFLGMTEIVGNKGAEALFNTISETFI